MENTEEGRRKFKQDFESIHHQFKEHVQRHRPELDIEKVATGEVWTGTEALELGLVDEVITSDAWMLKQLDIDTVFLKWNTVLRNRSANVLQKAPRRWSIR